jgi:hypothetical protein
MAEEVMAYCVKEKAQKPMKDAHEVTLKNGKHALQGTCASCGTKMMKFISSKKPATASASSQPHTGPRTEPTPPPSQPGGSMASHL